jgi:hypothetical protein
MTTFARRWPNLPEAAAIEGYTLDEVGAEKLRCIAERAQCRDLHDPHELRDGGHIEPLEAWALYLRKAANHLGHGRQRTPPRGWAGAFARRLAIYKRLWDGELRGQTSPRHGLHIWGVLLANVGRLALRPWASERRSLTGIAGLLPCVGLVIAACAAAASRSSSRRHRSDFCLQSGFPVSALARRRQLEVARKQGNVAEDLQAFDRDALPEEQQQVGCGST